MKKSFSIILLTGVLMCMPSMAQSNFSMKANKWAKTVNLKQDLSTLSYEELHMLKALVYATHGRWYTEPEINRVLVNKAEWYEPLCGQRMTAFYESGGEGEADLYTVSLTSDEQAFVNKIEARMQQLQQTLKGKDGLESTKLCINMSQVSKPSTDLLDRLNAYNFAIEQSDCDQLFNIYEKNGYEMMPSFVTTDVYLQLSHMYLAYVQKYIEKKYFIPTLQATLEGMEQQVAKARTSSLKKGVSDRLDKMQTYCAIGLNLLTGKAQSVPSLYKNLYDAEVENIVAAENAPSPFMEVEYYMYSLYKPRGHYTRSEGMERYFRSMMWVQTASFFSQNEDAVKNATILAMLFNSMPQDKRDDFRHMGEIITQLTGPSDNVSILQLADYLRANNITDFNVVNDKDTMAKVLAELVRLNNEHNQLSTKMEAITGFNINFMPQRFLCDNEVIGKLVDDTPNCDKAYPSGVNVFAVFGSKTAETLQNDFYRDPQRWENFDKIFRELHAKYAGKPIGGGTIYDRRLQLLVYLASRTDRTDYAFYNTPHWQFKDLNTSLASWATLKHDAILYAEQPMLAECGDGEDLPAPMPFGFVEPNKIFWDQLYLLIQDTESWLKRCGYIDDDISSKTENLLESIGFCKLIVDKELRGELPDYVERCQLNSIGSSLEWMTLGL
ncbi:MAG: DUF3160 domain-containing protein, partial [Bacteroidaceae bacterium]|nr:DUF3160 domain-containing protein [Bacteroidaceae bacterium]